MRFGDVWSSGCRFQACGPFSEGGFGRIVEGVLTSWNLEEFASGRGALADEPES